MSGKAMVAGHDKKIQTLNVYVNIQYMSVLISDCVLYLYSDFLYKRATFLASSQKACLCSFR